MASHGCKLESRNSCSGAKTLGRSGVTDHGLFSHGWGAQTRAFGFCRADFASSARSGGHKAPRIPSTMYNGIGLTTPRGR